MYVITNANNEPVTNRVYPTIRGAQIANSRARGGNACYPSGVIQNARFVNPSKAQMRSRNNTELPEGTAGYILTSVHSGEPYRGTVNNITLYGSMRSAKIALGHAGEAWEIRAVKASSLSKRANVRYNLSYQEAN